jgi:hypothetical protein
MKYRGVAGMREWGPFGLPASEDIPIEMLFFINNFSNIMEFQ